MTDAAHQDDVIHTPRLFQIDALRGIAAMVVMLYHLDLVYRIHGAFGRGYLFVDMFFLISGFVLAVSTERKLNAGIGALTFTRDRFFRLWPLVAVGAGVAVARGLAIGMDPLTLLLWLALDLAMIPSFAGAGPFYRLNGPQWTLFYELLANFVHALVLRKVSTRWMLALALGLGVALIVTVHIHKNDTMGVSAPTWDTWWMGLPRLGWSYVLGVWLGRKYKEGARGPVLPWWLALALPVVGIAIVPLLPLSAANGDLLVVMVFLPLVVWAVAQSHPPKALRPACEWFGNYSLPLYCVHLTILVWISEVFGRADWVRIVAVGAAMLVALIFSKLISFKAKPTTVRPAKA